MYVFLFCRTIGKASSESRLYFSALETRNFNSKLELYNAEESDSDRSFNIYASYLLGQPVYGNAILASVAYTWRGAELFNEDVSLRSYFRSLSLSLSLIGYFPFLIVVESLECTQITLLCRLLDNHCVACAFTDCLKSLKICEISILCPTDN